MVVLHVLILVAAVSHQLKVCITLPNMLYSSSFKRHYYNYNIYYNYKLFIFGRLIEKSLLCVLYFYTTVCVVIH